MKYFVFENPGVIDARSITTFGVSSKDTPATAIGFFGTGLKYAIAILLRNGCGITIYSGGKKYTFGVFREKIRNDEFNLVTMNNTKLGFTTELGKTWEVWQALRELHCNCVDELGASYENTTPDVQSRDCTKVVVQGSAFEQAWMHRASVFLQSAPIHTGEKVSIHPGSSEWVFYRGIRTYKLSTPSLYTYNILAQMQLTEDRTVKYDWYITQYVVEEVAKLTDEKMLDDILLQNMGAGSWERCLHFSSCQLGETIEAVALKHMREFNRNLNASLQARMREYAFEKLVSDDTDKLSVLDKKRLEKSLDFLKKIGHDCSAYPIVVSENLGENVLGRAHEGKIYLAHRVFMMGTKMVAGTVLEEYLHLKHGFSDCERPMQNFLFDALISMGEQVLGDVL